AAVATDDRRCRTPSVDDEDRPLPGRRIERSERLRERGGEEPAVAGGELGAEVDDLDAWRLAGGPRRQRDATVRSHPRSTDALDRGRRAPEDQRGAGEAGELDRGVACLEPWRAVALVRAIVFLVDDDEADIRERRPDREPRADDDLDAAGADPAPLVGPLAVGESRVDERDLGRDVGPQAVDEREGERDLRHEHERRAPEVERREDRLDVDGRLAGAGHAVEQPWRRVTVRDRVADRRDCFLLRPGERGVRRSAAPSARWTTRERPPFVGTQPDLDE